MKDFSKSEHLCGKTLFDEIISSKEGLIKFPLRAKFKVSSHICEHKLRIGISVSKRRFKHAVDRNRVKRLIRESYRLNKELYIDSFPDNKTIDILFVFIDEKLPDISRIEKSVCFLLQKISERINNE